MSAQHPVPQEYLPAGQAAPAPQKQTRPARPPVDPAYLVGKSGRQLVIMLDAIYTRNMNGVSVYFGQNKLGTRYCLFGNEFVFFEDTLFQDKLKHFAITYLHLTDLSQTAIKNVISILRAQPDYWAQEDQLAHNPYVRVVNLSYPNIFYHLTPSYYIQLSCQPLDNRQGNSGILHPSGAIWPQPPANHCFLCHDLNQIAGAANIRIPAILDLFHQIGIAEADRPLVLCWMVHSLVARDFYLLEFNSQEQRVHHIACEALKYIIDPSTHLLTKIPKKSMDLARLGLDDYLLALYADKRLSAEQQEALLELMTYNGIKVDGLKSKLDQAQCYIKRPVVLAADDTVIDDINLRARTLTFELDSNQASGQLPSSSNIDAARVELIRLAMVSSAAVYSEPQQAYQVEKQVLKLYPQHVNFVRLGVMLYSVLNPDQYQASSESNRSLIGQDYFLKHFTDWLQHNLFLEMDDHDIAYLIYAWAKDQTVVEQSYSESWSIKDWKQRLAFHAAAEQIELTDKSFRSIGEAFKASNRVLNKLGIRVESTGRGKRVSEWTITVPKKIGIAALVESNVQGHGI